ncbi:hypothetical protein MC885_016904 [Smutsia gigantea]|nr:hypothetical protein MC885_016904 [Smutsia gigantea]
MQLTVKALQGRECSLQVASPAPAPVPARTLTHPGRRDGPGPGRGRGGRESCPQRRSRAHPLPRSLDPARCRRTSWYPR